MPTNKKKSVNNTPKRGDGKYMEHIRTLSRAKLRQDLRSINYWVTCVDTVLGLYLLRKLIESADHYPISSHSSMSSDEKEYILSLRRRISTLRPRLEPYNSTYSRPLPNLNATLSLKELRRAYEEILESANEAPTKSPGKKGGVTEPQFLYKGKGRQ